MEMKRTTRGEPKEYQVRDNNGFLIGIVRLVSVEKEDEKTYYGLHIAHTERLCVKMDKAEDPRNWF